MRLVFHLRFRSLDKVNFVDTKGDLGPDRIGHADRLQYNSVEKSQKLKDSTAKEQNKSPKRRESGTSRKISEKGLGLSEKTGNPLAGILDSKSPCDDISGWISYVASQTELYRKEGHVSLPVLGKSSAHAALWRNKVVIESIGPRNMTETTLHRGRARKQTSTI